LVTYLGITIHYQGALNCQTQYVNQILDQVEDKLRTEGIISIKRSNDFNDEQEQKQAYQSINSGMIPTSIAGNPFIYTPHSLVKEPILPSQKRALHVNIHPGCETFSLIFYKNCDKEMWVLPYSFVKTQFAPSWVHVFICELLSIVEAMIRWKGGKFNVNDEGEYYYSKDIKKLDENTRYVDMLIGKVVNVLTSSEW